jgi:hypothetical protein
MNRFFSNFGGSFNGGVSTRGWGGNYDWGGNSGAVQGANGSWGGYYGGSNLTYNRPLREQPYDRFLLTAYKQPKLVATREGRRFGEDVISSIGPAGFWGRGSGYPLSLYVG